MCSVACMMLPASADFHYCATEGYKKKKKVDCESHQSIQSTRAPYSSKQQTAPAAVLHWHKPPRKNISIDKCHTKAKWDSVQSK